MPALASTSLRPPLHACLPACPPPYLQPVAVLEVLDAGDTAAVQVQVRQARQEVRQALVLACTTTTISSSSTDRHHGLRQSGERGAASSSPPSSCITHETGPTWLLVAACPLLLTPLLAVADAGLCEQVSRDAAGRGPTRGRARRQAAAAVHTAASGAAAAAADAAAAAAEEARTGLRQHQYYRTGRVWLKGGCCCLLACGAYSGGCWRRS